MAKIKLLSKLKGKTIKRVTANMAETADSCAYATVEFEFTDKTSFSFQLRCMPDIQGMYFPDDNSSEEAALVAAKSLL